MYLIIMGLSATVFLLNLLMFDGSLRDTGVLIALVVVFVCALKA